MKKTLDEGIDFTTRHNIRKDDEGEYAEVLGLDFTNGIILRGGDILSVSYEVKVIKKL